MTKQEAAVLYKVLAKRLDVAKLPQFLLETYTSAERDVLEDFHRDHLGWFLYLLLPPGIKIPEVNAKYTLIHMLLLACGDDPAAKAVIEHLCLDVYSIHCEAKSGIAVFRFVRREVRDFWAGRVLKLGRGTVTPQATDSLVTAVPRAGKDEAARGLLYHVFLRGDTTIRHAELRAIVTAVAHTTAYHVEYVESIGIRDLSGPRWKVSFNQITCPKAFEGVRRLLVQLNGRNLVYEVHHPRTSNRVPCDKCLSVRHPTKDCKNTRASESLARHTREVTVTTGPGLPKWTATSSPQHCNEQLAHLRRVAAPALEARFKAEDEDRHAKTRRQAKLAADAAAREAAAEARLQQAAKDHLVQDTLRREKERARAAHKKVTAQLRALHKRIEDLRLHQGAEAPSTAVVLTSTSPTEAHRTAPTSFPLDSSEGADTGAAAPLPPPELPGSQAPPAQPHKPPSDTAITECPAPSAALTKPDPEPNQSQPSESSLSFQLLQVVPARPRPGKRAAPASPPRVDGSYHMAKWQQLGGRYPPATQAAGATRVLCSPVQS